MRISLRLLISVFIAAIAFAIGLAVTNVVEASSGAWLGFSGALLGAGLAVLGGITVIVWQQGSEARRRRELLLAELREIVSLCEGFHSADEPALRERTGNSVNSQTKEIRSTIERLWRVLEWMRPDSAAMLRAFDQIHQMREGYDELECGLNWQHAPGADLGGLNATGHKIASNAMIAIALLN